MYNALVAEEIKFTTLLSFSHKAEKYVERELLGSNLIILSNTDSLFDFLRGQNQGEGGPSMELIPLVAGSGGFKAEFAQNADGEKIIKLDGNIDYSIRGDNETLPFDIYINYGVHGEK